jgi:hypothetical protein
MNVGRRIRISWLAIYFIRARFRVLYVASHALVIPAWLVQLQAALTKRKNHRRIAVLKNASDSLTVRFNSFQAEWQVFSQATSGNLEIRRQHLLATQSALLAENGRLQAAVAELRSAPAIGAPLAYTLASAKARLLRIQQKRDALAGIMSQIKTSPNFYWDLVLWFVLPGAHVEDQIGDLNEEFLLRNATEGEVQANAWYRRQVTASIMPRLWAKIERLAAIGTLIDFVWRWFRK